MHLWNRSDTKTKTKKKLFLLLTGELFPKDLFNVTCRGTLYMRVSVTGYHFGSYSKLEIPLSSYIKQLMITAAERLHV